MQGDAAREDGEAGDPRRADRGDAVLPLRDALHQQEGLGHERGPAAREE